MQKQDFIEKFKGLTITNGESIFTIEQIAQLFEDYNQQDPNDFWQHQELDWQWLSEQNIVREFNDMQSCENKPDDFELLEDFEINNAKRNRFLERFPELDFTLLIDDSDFESQKQYITPCHISTSAHVVAELLQGKYNETDLDKYLTIEDVEQGLLDSGDWIVSCMTTPEWQKWKANQEREELEHQASAIAHHYKVKVNSPEFLDACQSELDRFSSYREGMREDGLCIGWGVSPEQWYDEYNSSQGDSENIYRIMRWVEEQMPLLYAKWEYDQQQKAA